MINRCNIKQSVNMQPLLCAGHEELWLGGATRVWINRYRKCMNICMGYYLCGHISTLQEKSNFLQLKVFCVLFQ